jgi:peptide/nickel transport system substrate-binding protein
MFKIKTSLLVSLILFIITACAAPVATPTNTPPPPQQTVQALTALPSVSAPAGVGGSPTPVFRTPSVTDNPLSLSTALPPINTNKTLTLCMPYEPETLYEYGQSSRDGLFAQAAVFEALRDGPIDQRNFDSQAILLEKLPSFKDGDAAIAAVTVRDGEELIDSSGGLIKLASGIKYFDQDGVERTYNGQARSVRTMQMTVTFKLKAGLKWEDGQPLTADDVVFAWQLAKSPDSPNANHFLTNRMRDPIVVVDNRTIRWTYLPGYKDALYYARFPAPYPKHLYGKFTPAQMNTDPNVNRKPLSFGPFKMQEWVTGKQITLVKNQNYFRASEGLPRIDKLIYRFIPEADTLYNELITGKCDVGFGVRSGTTDSIFDGKFEQLLKAKTQGTLNLHVVPSKSFEHLDFNISPVENYTGVVGEGLWQNVKMRQAFAYCLDRKALADSFYFGQVDVPTAYVPNTHPFFDPTLPTYTFNAEQGRALLKELGWADANKDGVLDKQGFSLSLKYIYGPTNNKLRQSIAAKVSKQLKDTCGIQLELREADRTELFGDFPNGMVFGRRFDLAQFAWVMDVEPPCTLYLSREWSGAGDGNPDKYKLSGYPQGTNNVGYRSSSFEDACLRATNTLDRDEKKKFHQQALKIFAQDLPSLMLFAKPRVVVARPTVSGLLLDSSAETDLWNLELFDIK